MWADDEWDGFCLLLEGSWPGDFSKDSSTAYRVILDDVPAGDAVAAVKRLLHAGNRFRPSLAELLAEIRRDPSQPTFPEAYQLIYGPGGVLRTQPSRKGGLERYDSEADRRRAFNEAAHERAKDLHPLVASFVARYGIERLRALPVDDPVWGVKTQNDLENAWEKHVEITDGRDIATLTSGGTGGELRQLDPLAALGLKRKELEA